MTQQQQSGPKTEEHADQTAPEKRAGQALKRRARWANAPGQACSTGGAQGKDLRGTCCPGPIFLILIQLQVLLFTRSEDFPVGHKALKQIFYLFFLKKKHHSITTSVRCPWLLNGRDIVHV